MNGAPPTTKQKTEVMVEQSYGGSVIEINERCINWLPETQHPGNINFRNVTKEYQQEYFNSVTVRRNM